MHDKLIEAVARAMACHFSMNRMPHMSGDPLNRLGGQERRRLDDATEAALTALCAARPDVAALLSGEAAWKPIETAPDGYEHVLLWDRAVGLLHGWKDRDGKWCHAWDSEYIPSSKDLTHWMPLPASPWAQEEKRDE